MSLTRLTSIHRYPVKGFGAQELSETDLQPGQGIPFDRCLAIANGGRALAGGGEWTPCQAFVRLTKNPDLPRYALAFDEAANTATLLGPDGRAVAVHGDGTGGADDALAGWFAPGPLGPPRAVAQSRSGGAGYWDHEDAAISVINLATIATLERSAGRPVNPMRFRANLYVAGLPPFQELAFIGRLVRVGEAVLEVLRPTDRCRATSVDPATGDTGLNVPALLARTQGHIYCGVYARVVQAGRIMPGDPVEDLGPAPGAARDGAGAATAPPVSDWPRVARVVERVAESANVVSLWLDDPLAFLRVPPRAGQHLRVHVLDGEGRAAWRCYTISGVEASKLRISVKRDGTVSNLLHDARPAGGHMLISGPYGNVCLRDEANAAGPVVLLSAGIGITPTVAMLRGLATSGSDRRVFVGHVARDGVDLALWAEARDLVRRLPGASAQLYLSQASAGACEAHGAIPGRMPFDAMLQRLPPVREADTYVCGPAGFLADARAALLRAGASPGRVHVEVFASPKAGAAPSRGQQDGRRLHAAGPFQVRFVSGGVETTWTPQAGTLLDVAEAAGLAPAANCRGGVCGACRTPLLSGSVNHDPEPALPIGTDAAYLCCAVPVSDVILA